MSDDPKHTAELDQMIAAARDLAAIQVRHYTELLAQGMEPYHALSLTAALGSDIIHRPPDDDTDGWR